MSYPTINFHYVVSIETRTRRYGSLLGDITRDLVLRDSQGGELVITAFADRDAEDLAIRDMDIIVEELEAEEIEVTA